MGVLLDRPNGPTSGAASVPNQIPLNTQGAQNGPLPALLTLTSNAETLVPSAELPTVPLTINLNPANGPYEQRIFDAVASGIVTTKNASNVTIKVYEGAAIAGGNLLGTSGAIAVNTATCTFYAKLLLMLDSVSGNLVGTIKFYLNEQVVAEVTLSNFVTGFNTIDNINGNPQKLAVMPQFCLSFTSSAASAGNPTTASVQAFSCG